jgi:homoserine O-succinyltransferase
MTKLAKTRETDQSSLNIGLVNNMPDSAMEATERQFRTLLSEAAPEGISIHLSLFAIPEVARSDKARACMGGRYSDINELWEKSLDGLIVTGAEPVARNLKDEPFWSSLKRLIEWAERNTSSSVWSCLAAQAAVLGMSGIERRPLGEKLFGVFECESLSDHPLTAGMPSSFRMPHSRWNDIPGEDLSACGYRILTQLTNGIVDAFVKEGTHLSVFFQGHPEYELASLLLEYKRDIRRYLAKERELYPAMPENYFDENAAASLSVLRARAHADRCQQTFLDFPASVQAATMKNRWRHEAIGFYRNWLGYLNEQRSMKLESRRSQIEYAFKSVATAALRPLQGAEAG